MLKEGLHFAESERNRIAKLVQYQSSGVDGWTTFEGYVSRMKPDQKAIYYAAGASRQLIESSPHLEGLRKRQLHIDGAWRDHLCYALTVEDVPGGLLTRWRKVREQRSGDGRHGRAAPEETRGMPRSRSDRPR